MPRILPDDFDLTFPVDNDSTIREFQRQINKWTGAIEMEPRHAQNSSPLRWPEFFH